MGQAKKERRLDCARSSINREAAARIDKDLIGSEWSITEPLVECCQELIP